ncbi:MAG: metallopeptidase family protein [Bdellovibrionales bacterium]
MELYHVIADSDCADVRRLVVELGLQEHINFRNVGVSDEAKADLIKLVGEKTVPALVYDGAVLTGKAAIVEYLEQMARDPAFTLYPEFDKLANQVWQDVMGLIPRDLAKSTKNIQFLIQDEPTEEQVQNLPEELQAHPEELCGLHVGTPITQASVVMPDVLPPQVILFRFALLDLLDPADENSEQNLKQEIAITLLHEVGHHFGLSEEDLDRLGYS